MKKKIAMLPGDGIGVEVAEAAAIVLKAIEQQFGHAFEMEIGLIGGSAIDDSGNPLPEETLKLCRESDAIFLGAVGGPKWDSNPVGLRPETGLLGLRKTLNLFANIRPVKTYSSLAACSPLKHEVLQNVDMVIVRELTGGLYFGKPSERGGRPGEEDVVDTLYYKRSDMQRLIKAAFDLASVRGGHVTSVDKANVLESSRMWREVAEETADIFKDIPLNHMLVDHAAMRIISSPSSFDVLVTENMFGDILSDEAAMVTGSLGMLPSASFSEQGLHMYEPVHGSAPDIAGENLANPIGAILSAAMMLRHSFSMEEEAAAIENAVEQVLKSGVRTRDLAGGGETYLTTSEMTKEIVNALGDDFAIHQIMEAYA
ncbi:3-isopropylmalate dehydrogenase [Bacillus lacus]|uniref:3-isopropylmalate dehydrogenase n=1 Tax=Metabacillus lacus TaxID=1983721 RepID=A0A7X2J2P1_9BACI|nr:3-isopropylmalate dehydrogenase [Metabacillus lacus]